VQFVDGSRAYMRLLIDQPSGDLTLPPIRGEIKDIVLNPFNSVLAKVEQ
jgi:hypothetical protein